MTNDFEKRFRESVNSLHFSASEKHRLYRNLVHAATSDEKEDYFMKRRTFSKTAAIAALVLALTGGTVFAMTHIVSLSTSSSVSDYKYTYANLDQALDKAGIDADIPETFSNGYTFDRAALLDTQGSDEGGNAVATWPELDVHYVNSQNENISLSAEDSANLLDSDARDATEVKTIDGIEVSYNLDEYLFLPPSEEETGLDASVQERLDNDSHFFVSYGSTEEEHSFFSSVSFVKEGVYYLISAYNTDLTPEEMFEMSAEIIEL